MVGSLLNIVYILKKFPLIFTYSSVPIFLSSFGKYKCKAVFANELVFLSGAFNVTFKSPSSTLVIMSSTVSPDVTLIGVPK